MEKDNKTQKIVQTYAEDIAKVIENDKGGLIKKIIHGAEEHEREKSNLSPESKKNRFFMFVSLFLILIASSIFFFFILKKTNPTVPVEKQFTPLIFNDKSVFVEIKDFTKEQIAQIILNEVNTTPVKNGGVEGIYPTLDKKIIGLREFLTFIKSNFSISDSSGNVFVNDNFLMGVVKSESNSTSTSATVSRDFFILLKVRSISDVFGSLRAWENKMFFDLHGFFGIDLTYQTKYLLTKEFRDEVIDNKNARVLYDNENKIVMMYILADDNSIIITNTKNATHEIILRLVSSQVKK